MSEEKKIYTEHDRELVVLASMIHPKTAEAAKKAIIAARFRPDDMLIDPEAAELFTSFTQSGAEVFGGKLCGISIARLAKADIREHLKSIMAAWRRKMAETDRTLDSFETPGRDSEDPDCLFQNRWLRRGACGAIVSTSGVGKSSFSMQAAVMWAAGAECLGLKPTRPLKIGIFQSEDDEYDVANFRDRIRIGLAAELNWRLDQIQTAESHVTFCALNGSTGPRFVQHLEAKQKLHHFDLVIINPLFAFFGSNTNDGSEMTAFLRHGIDRVIKNEETKCGCIIIHHCAKPNRERLEMGDTFAAYLGSGSSEFTNYVRTALVITPQKGAGYGVFDLIAAKHGDKLGWRDENDRPTMKKTICYANRLEDRDSRMIFWMEPNNFQLAAIKDADTAASKPKLSRERGDTAEDAKYLATLCTDAPRTRSELRDAAREHFRRNRGDRAYDYLIEHLRSFGMVEMTVGNVAKIGFEKGDKNNDLFDA